MIYYYYVTLERKIYNKMTIHKNMFDERLKKEKESTINLLIHFNTFLIHVLAGYTNEKPP